jgi:hypothetical protein
MKTTGGADSLIRWAMLGACGHRNWLLMGMVVVLGCWNP